MIDLNKGKIRKILEDFRYKVSSRHRERGCQDENVLLLHRIIWIIGEECGIEPTECARALNSRFGYDVDSYELIRILKKNHLGNPREREEVFEWANDLVRLFPAAISGDVKSFNEFNEKRRKKIINITGPSNPQNCIVTSLIFHRHPELDEHGLGVIIRGSGIVEGKYFLYDLIDAMASAYDFDNARSGSGAKGRQADSSATIDQLLRENRQLQSSLEIANSLLKDLQEDFDRQLTDAKEVEMTQFFSAMNSEKNGRILDLLLKIRKGVDELRSRRSEIPDELDGVLILIKKLIQFVRDYNINPIMKKPDAHLIVKASQVESCVYIGSPFNNEEEKKTVAVVSPGWMISDKEIIISKPVLKEEDNGQDCN